ADISVKYQSAVALALESAGDNASELRTALEKAPASQIEGLAFLIAHMPGRDLRSLNADYLLENLEWAYKARAEVPWGAGLDDDLFFNDVLPYASINERRDNWRRDFHGKFLPLIKDCKSPGEAAQILNREMWKIIDVRYHASKRPKPDQSPYESMDANYASCSGLSVLLIDACRAVSVPARFVGTPEWSTKRGNHSWVEVWDGGQWKFTGACEFNPAGLNKAWFAGDASKAIKDESAHAIYATSWKKTGGHFPLVWDRSIDYVGAVNVTDRYAPPPEKPGTPARRVFIQVFDRPGGDRVPVDVEILRAGESIATGRTRGPDDDTNNMLAVQLKEGVEYQLHILRSPKSDGAKGTPARNVTFTPSGREDEQIRFDLREE
ncbi:MAG: transglutaminase-like domain-containing protein, partial [Verrucomicrobiales bacterium]